MVKPHHVFLLLVVLSCTLVIMNTTLAQGPTYHLNQEWVQIWINSDGSIDLFYNISITTDSGQINYVSVGQPNGDFTIANSTDQHGNILQVQDVSSGTDYKIEAKLASPLNTGQTVWLTFVTNVAKMIFEDNRTNVGMEFTPSWYPQPVNNLRLLVVLPQGVNTSDVATLPNEFWDSIILQPDGRWGVYWEKQNLTPDQKYTFGLSFPKGYTTFVPKSTGPDLLGQYLPPVLGVGFIIAILGVIIAVARKKSYLNPTVSMETLGIRRGLTAVEASYILEMKPTMIVTEILYSLLQKKVIWVESSKPSIKIKIMDAFKDKKGTRDAPLRYYEIDFLNALKDDGSLGEEKLAGTVMYLRDTVEEKMRGFQRKDTVDYYRQIVDKAWQQVAGAGTPELASNAYDEQLLWLFLDPNYKTKTQTAFQNTTFVPNPMWFWYWYGYQQYHPNPTYTPTIGTSTQAGKPPTFPGADFANNIASAVENTSNSIVVNLEKFANSILPFSPGKASHDPAHPNASCVCACATCACACACVSCACACAGGGARIKGRSLQT
jgi:hypothetical protein